MSTYLPHHTQMTNGVGRCGKLMWWRCDEKYNAIERLDRDDYVKKVGKEPFADGGFCDEIAYGTKDGCAPTGSPLFCPKHGGPKEITPPC